MHRPGCAHVCLASVRELAAQECTVPEPPCWKNCLGSAAAVLVWPLAVGHFAGPENPAKHPCCWFQSQEEVLGGF